MKSKSVVSVFDALTGRSSNFNRALALATRQSSATFAVAIATLLGSQLAQAVTYYWDANGTAITAVAPTGTWGTSAFWSTDPAGASATSNPTITSADDVIFSAGTTGTAGTVTVQTTKAASSITFDDNVAVTLSGGTSITLGGTGTNSGVFVASGANANSTISTPLILSANSTVQNAGLGTIGLSGGITGTGNLILNNNAGNNTGFNISGTTNIAGSITNSGTGAGGVISNAIGTNVTGVIQNSANSFLRLSGNNLYTSGTTITAGALSFITTAAKPASGMTTVAAGATLGLGVSGGGGFSSTDVDNLFAGNLVGNLANVTIDSTSRAGIDTTAGDSTYASNITGSRTLHKLGVNALTLTGNNNAASGETIVAVAGTLRVGNSTNFTGGTLSLVGLPNATAPVLDLRNDVATDFAKGLLIASPAGTGNSSHTINVDRAIGGSGTGNVHTIGVISQPSAGSRTLTITGANGYGLNINELSLSPGAGQNTTLAANVNVTVNEVTNPMSGFISSNWDTLTLAGSSTSSSVIGVIEDAVGGSIAAGGTTRLSKSGTGTWTINNANTYTGRTTIAQGTLNVASLNRVVGGTASSSLGAPTTVSDATLQMGATATIGNLNYTGAGESTDRVINLAGTTGGGTITQSGTNLLIFTGANTATGAGSKTLTLDGSTAGTGEIAGAIVENTVTNKTSVTKNGTNTWTLSGANTYTGSTNANGGILQLDMSGTGSLSAGTALTLAGGTFAIKGNASGSTPTVASLAVNGGAGKIAINPNGGITTLTITSPTLTRAPGGVVNFDTSAGTPATARIAWAPTVTNGIIGAAYTMTDNTGTGLATITGGFVTRLGLETVLTDSNPTSATTDFVTNTPGTITNSVSPVAELNSLSIDTTAGASTWNLGGGNTATVTSGALLMRGPNNFTIQNGILKSNTVTNSNLAINQSGAGILTIDSQISNGNGASTVAKFGAGTLVLGGSNTYTGNTTVSGGTLVLSGSSTTAGIFLNGGTDTTLLVTNPSATGSGMISSQTGATNPNVQFHINGGGTITLPNSLGGNSGVTTTIDVDNNGDASTNGVIQLTGSSGSSSIGNATINVTGGNGYSLVIDNLRNTGGAAGTLLLNPTTAAVSLGNVTVNPSVTTTTGTYVLGLGGTNSNNSVTGVISDNTAGPALYSVTKSDTGTWTLSGANTYTGATNVNAGTLKVGSAIAFTSKGALSMAGSGILDLNGFDAAFTNVSASVATNTITDNSAGTGVSTLTISNQSSTVSALVKNGASRTLKVNLRNANSGVVSFNATSANTFSGGLTLQNTVTGTRLRISAAVSTVGSPGAIVSSPFGTGPITIGEAASDKAGVLLDTVSNITIANAIVFNTALGTDAQGIRLDTVGHIFSGTISANLSDAIFARGGSGTGAATLTGQITGPRGLQLNATSVSITLNNGTVNANNYDGDTTLGTGSTLRLGAANQIPNGALKGSLVSGGTFNLSGFSETINGLSGAGAVTSSSGTPTLTLGDSDATASFSGSTGGSLSLTKIGTGTQTLSGAIGHAGDTTVSGGSLAIGLASTFANASTIRLTTGANLNLTAAGTDVVNALFIDGVAQASGLWGRLGSGVANETGLITGDGLLSVTTSGAASTYDTFIASFFPGETNPAIIGKTADPDSDGVNNITEFGFDGNPASGSSGPKIHVFTADSDFDGDAISELILTVAVRNGTAAFATGAPATAASAVDNITYTIQGSTTLSTFLDTVNVVPTAVTTGLPATSSGYSYRSFSLAGSNGLANKGFLRAGVITP